MSATSGPYGLTPVGDQVGQPRPLRMPGFVASGYGSNIYYGQPFYMSGGFMVPVTLTTNKIFGVFAGCQFTPLGGSPTYSGFWPAGSVIDTSNDFFANFWLASVPSMRWAIQADGSVPQSGMGRQYVFSNITGGSTRTGLSTLSASATPVASGGQGQVELIEFGTGVSSAIGDAYTDLIVRIAPGAFQTGTE